MPAASSSSAPAQISSRRCEACACSSPGRSPTASAPRRPCARAATPSCWRRCCARRRSRSCSRTRRSAPSCSPARMRRAPSRTHPGRAQLTALTAFTVGRRTAEAARAVGFRDVRSADGDKRDLVDLLRADLRALRTDLCACATRRCSISPARTAPAISPPPACPCTPRWSIARSRPSTFRRRSRRRWRSASSTASCIFPPAARRPISTAPRAAGSAIRRLRRCITALAPGRGAAVRRRRRCDADCGPPRRDGAAGACGIGVTGVSRASAASALARAERDPGTHARRRGESVDCW